jgi:ABC-type cobalt transport system substrate-binding protein
MNINDPKTRAIVIVIAIVLTIFLFKVGGDFLVDRIADRVIERIRQNYSPSRYGPGIDPDKLEIDDSKIQKKRPWN